MDRVRVGLSGLGAVFLLTLGVSLVFGRPDASPQVAESTKEPEEPLAQLGVAPSNEPKIVVPPAAPEGYVPPVSSSQGAAGQGAAGETLYESPVQTPSAQSPAGGAVGSKVAATATIAI